LPKKRGQAEEVGSPTRPRIGQKNKITGGAGEAGTPAPSLRDQQTASALYFRRESVRKSWGAPRLSSLLQHRGDGPCILKKSPRLFAAGRARHPGSRSGWMAHLESAPVPPT